MWDIPLEEPTPQIPNNVENYVTTKLYQYVRGLLICEKVLLSIAP
jgi:hypothetical protein